MYKQEKSRIKNISSANDLGWQSTAENLRYSLQMMQKEIDALTNSREQVMEDPDEFLSVENLENKLSSLQTCLELLKREDERKRGTEAKRFHPYRDERKHRHHDSKKRSNSSQRFERISEKNSRHSQVIQLDTLCEPGKISIYDNARPYIRNTPEERHHISDRQNMQILETHERPINRNVCREPDKSKPQVYVEYYGEKILLNRGHPKQRILFSEEYTVLPRKEGTKIYMAPIQDNRMLYGDQQQKELAMDKEKSPNIKMLLGSIGRETYVLGIVNPEIMKKDGNMEIRTLINTVYYGLCYSLRVSPKWGIGRAYTNKLVRFVVACLARKFAAYPRNDAKIHITFKESIEHGQKVARYACIVNIDDLAHYNPLVHDLEDHSTTGHASFPSITFQEGIENTFNKHENKGKFHVYVYSDSDVKLEEFIRMTEYKAPSSDIMVGYTWIKTDTLLKIFSRRETNFVPEKYKIMHRIVRGLDD